VGKNVAVFVDVANIFYAAKAAGVDIDYVTLLKSATAGRDFVRAYAYTGLDPENENQRNFHAFLARNHYKVVSKDIRKYGDGKVKANLDIELVVDMMKTARNLDIAIVVSGDGDFAPAIRAVQEMGVRVEVISFRGNTSSDLIEVADLFTDITQLARVDKSSSRSGRRVAGDDEDLSMTEVPDKQTEGTGTRGRGRGRGRGRPGEAEPVAAIARRRPVREEVAASSNGSGSLTVLPGERLSRVAPAATPSDEAMDDEEAAAEEAYEASELGDQDAVSEDGRRRRRRRGGRGRGRGRGRGDEAGAPAQDEQPARAGVADDADDADEPEREAEPEPITPRGPRTTPFGSVWDSQLGVGTPTAGRAPLEPLDDEDFDEPEIPEYLIAEQRRGRQGQGQGQNRGGARGGRGARSAYNAAIERERYGTGPRPGGINRYPDVSGRDRQPGSGSGSGQRPQGGNRQGGFNRPERMERVERPARSSSGDPWTEVPPELEEMLRAQLAQSGKGRQPARPAGGRPERRDRAAEETAPMTASGGEAAPSAPAEAEAATEAPSPRRRASTRRTAAAPDAEPTTAASAASSSAAGAGAGDEPAPVRRRTTRRSAGPAAEASAAVGDVPSEATADSAAPKRRTTRRTTAGAAADAAPAEAGDAGTADDAPAAPKRRVTRKKADPA
jgi:uncharacterized LabA/DUF88 family protein